MPESESQSIIMKYDKQNKPLHNMPHRVASDALCYSR